MSIRTELEALAKWMADRSEEEPADEPPQVDSETWERVRAYLLRASEQLEARAKADTRPLVAEFARDMANEADALALRARLHARLNAKSNEELTREESNTSPAETIAGARACLLDKKHPDAVAFGKELDLLAEMVLTLPQENGRPEPEPEPEPTGEEDRSDG